MSRLGVALVAYAVIALLVRQTIGDERIRWVTWAILAMFALRTLAYAKMNAASGESSEQSAVEVEAFGGRERNGSQPPKS